MSQTHGAKHIVNTTKQTNMSLQIIESIHFSALPLPGATQHGVGALVRLDLPVHHVFQGMKSPLQLLAEAASLDLKAETSCCW